jgi:hypothetical protein
MVALWKSLVPVPVPSPPAPNGQPDAAAGPKVPVTPSAPKPRPTVRKRPRLPDAAPVQQQEVEEEEFTELSGGRPRRKAAKKAVENIHGWTAELRKKDQTPNKVSSHHFCCFFVFSFFS